MIHAQRRKLVILTFDKDFSHIKRIKISRQTGIIWIKNIRVSQTLLTHMIHQLLLSRPPVKFLGRLTIVEPHRIRSIIL